MKKAIWRAFPVIVFIAFASCNTSSTAVPISADVVNSREEVITMQVIVQVSADVASALHQRGTLTAKSKELVRIIEIFNLTLHPMHRDTDDPNLQSYFIVEVPDHATAQRVTDRLRRLEAVKAAYVKPPDELP
ncbi:MAG: hypothetical protein DWB56_14060 [Candidatus Jettenia sp.]|uniref:DUF4296 domain-containing protein n=1 Tax=Candidatus Jettenia caeni TaxID=247490 RepID=I3II96_9BACT|nr:hypothetical protein [Candidatus Jettenia sp. AMX1]MBC6930058.1 hypothetical protein [Candidatus Jettenia sp.]NUN21981.1 hypothetical protein [Candidatus Jettenia caeni]KAA0248167.1 MAG: hypothetical protein EDM77_13285 [Candidatus Jettenia sp. AMX1]MCE7881736.1 hypothetical protein [Candidatus Jettenia sp. AMX1]MCQ3928361.1 hypothetical protein [Candidatus Jettenia sp.]